MILYLYSGLISLVALLLGTYCLQLRRSNSKFTEKEAVWEREKRTLEAVAYTDTLTGAMSRYAFGQEVAHTYQRLNRERKEGQTHSILAVIFMDVRRLKATNDNLGHGVGDQLLRRVAEIIRENLRVGDRFARYGGDEFAAYSVFTGEYGELEALAYAWRNRLRKALREIVVSNGINETFQVDVGVKCIDFRYKGSQPISIEEALRLADEDMYDQKNNG